jgi:glucosamine--fructose-6-phosphate aminotransferase (isomerizing)
MCGIFGIVTNKDQRLGPLMIEAGQRLSYRGYDSAGCATLQADGKIDLRKDVGKLDDVGQRMNFGEMHGSRGILQLRWATFGHPSQVNAQPHLDTDGDLVGAHNGNVVNNVELRQQFIDEGMLVRSTNDGESCVHAVERYINQGLDLVEATRCAYVDLQGDYAFVIGKAGEDRLCAIKKGSGLVVGLGEEVNYVSTDLPTLLPLTRRIIRILDGEIVTLWADRVEIRRVVDGKMVERSPEVMSNHLEAVNKNGYAHFMLKEIFEQPVRAAELVQTLEDSPHVLHMVERMMDARHLYLVGCGSSYHASLMGAIYGSHLAGKSAIAVPATQFIAQYGPSLGSNDVAIFTSQSGETKDILAAEEIARQKGVSTLGIVNIPGSTLARVTEYVLPLACGYEMSVPATKSFTNQLIGYLYLALKMSGLPTANLVRLPELLQQTLDSSAPQAVLLAEELANWDEFYCLGYGATYPVALEGALKIKEVSYIHCEGLISTEFKHGPLSAVKPKYPVLFIAGPQDTSVMVSGINEVLTRYGQAIVIGELDRRLKANASKLIPLPVAGALFNPILAVLPLQLLAYQLCLVRGGDPDQPRNLSKTLMVD